MPKTQVQKDTEAIARIIDYLETDEAEEWTEILNRVQDGRYRSRGTAPGEDLADPGVSPHIMRKVRTLELIHCAQGTWLTALRKAGIRARPGARINRADVWHLVKRYAPEGVGRNQFYRAMEAMGIESEPVYRGSAAQRFCGIEAVIERGGLVMTHPIMVKEKRPRRDREW